MTRAHPGHRDLLRRDGRGRGGGRPRASSPASSPPRPRCTRPSGAWCRSWPRGTTWRTSARSSPGHGGRRRVVLRRSDAVAVTQGPGLIGSLLVGVQAAKGIAFVHGKPLVPVHHIAGHIEAPFLAHGEIPLPALALVVSGGHTSLFEVPGARATTGLRGRTRDDAAGRGLRQGRQAARAWAIRAARSIDRLAAGRQRPRGGVHGGPDQGRQRRLLLQRHQDGGALPRPAAKGSRRSTIRPNVPQRRSATSWPRSSAPW